MNPHETTLAHCAVAIRDRQRQGCRRRATGTYLPRASNGGGAACRYTDTEIHSLAARSMSSHRLWLMNFSIWSEADATFAFIS